MGEDKKRNFAAFVLKEMEKLPKEEAYCSPMTVVCVDGVVKTSSLMMIALCPWIKREDPGDVSLILNHCDIKMKDFENFMHHICTTQNTWQPELINTFSKIATILQVNNQELKSLVLSDRTQKMLDLSFIDMCAKSEPPFVIETSRKIGNRDHEDDLDETSRKIGNKDQADDLDSGPINFNCPSCSYSSGVLAVLHQHIRNTHEETVTCFQCDICKFSTKNENSFQKHMDTHVETMPTVDILNLECPLLRSEEEEHRQECRHTNKQTSVHGVVSEDDSPLESTDLRTNFLLVKTSKSQSLVDCGEPNIDVSTLVKSNLQVPIDEEVDEEDPLMDDEEDPVLDEDGCVKCRHCSTFFKYSRSLCHHLLSVHDEKCSECAGNVPEMADNESHPISNRIPLLLDPLPTNAHQSLTGLGPVLTISGLDTSPQPSPSRIPPLEPGPGRIPCLEPGCNKVFPNAGLLATHKKWHDPVRMLPKCRKCRTIFSTEVEVSEHMTENPNCGSTSCVVCGNVYTSIYTLKRHMQSHTGERPYKCHICSKAFTQRPVLMDHLVLHTGQKRFKCSQCSKSFQQKNHLKYHMLSAHNMGKRHSCSACEKEFPFHHQLVRHQKKIHGITVVDGSKKAQYVCSDCPERSFVTDTNYRQHRKTVHGEIANETEITVHGEITNEADMTDPSSMNVDCDEDGQMIRMEETEGELTELVVDNVCVGEDGTLVWKTEGDDSDTYQILKRFQDV